jgi:hypothetical protein
MQYRLTEQRANLVIRTLDTWLRLPELDRIAVDAVDGSGGARQQAQAGSYSRAELEELGSAEALIDLVVEEHGQRGGKLQLRGIFRDTEGNETSKRKTLQLTRVSPGERTGSQGRDAGFERLASSLSSAVDGLGRRLDHSQDQVVAALKDQAGSGQQFYQTMLQLQAQGSETALTQAVSVEALSRQVQHEREITELRIQMMEQESIWTELLPQLLPSLVSGLVPVFAGLGRLIEAKSVVLEQSSLTEEHGQQGTSQGAPQPTEPVHTPEEQPEPPLGTLGS